MNEYTLWNARIISDNSIVHSHECLNPFNLYRQMKCFPSFLSVKLQQLKSSRGFPFGGCSWLVASWTCMKTRQWLSLQNKVHFHWIHGRMIWESEIRLCNAFLKHYLMPKICADEIVCSCVLVLLSYKQKVDLILNHKSLIHFDIHHYFLFRFRKIKLSSK